MKRRSSKDWHYGIRRLLAEGSRPDVIVLCMSATGMMASDIRGDYSRYCLFQLSDIPTIARELHYDLTQTSPDCDEKSPSPSETITDRK